MTAADLLLFGCEAFGFLAVVSFVAALALSGDRP